MMAVCNYKEWLKEEMNIKDWQKHFNAFMGIKKYPSINYKSQWSLNSSMHQNCIVVWLTTDCWPHLQRFCSLSLGQGLRRLISNKFPGDSDAISWRAHFENHSSRILWLTRYFQNMSIFHRYFQPSSHEERKVQV